MSVADTIKRKLQGELQPTILQIENESHMHSGPATESHFKLTVVTPKFNSLSRVQRHQAVYKLLAEELQNDVHALALHLFTPEEW
ncbi:MAG: BolA family protein, partial [Gammaproteobacteria bacterium]